MTDAVEALEALGCFDKVGRVLKVVGSPLLTNSLVLLPLLRLDFFDLFALVRNPYHCNVDPIPPSTVFAAFNMPKEDREWEALVAWLKTFPGAEDPEKYVRLVHNAGRPLRPLTTATRADPVLINLASLTQPDAVW